MSAKRRISQKKNKFDLLQISDLTVKDVEDLLKRAKVLKEKLRKGIRYFPLSGKSLGLIFEHESTRTRVAFEVGIHQLGGKAIFLSAKDTQIGRGEPMADTARVLSRYVNAIAARLDHQSHLEELASYAAIPVINALTQERHPCQVLADLLTVQEHFRSLHDRKVVYMGDSNNVSNSWIEAAAVLGFELVVCTPGQYKPDIGEVLGRRNSSKNIQWITDPTEAVHGADVISTDVWVSMGSKDSQQKKEILQPYQVNSALLKKAPRHAIVLHCLPAHRNEEITAEVIEGSQSQIFNQAENKLHAQKAVLERCMKG